MLLWGIQGSQILIMLPTKQHIQCKYPSSLLARGPLSHREGRTWDAKKEPGLWQELARGLWWRTTGRQLRARRKPSSHRLPCVYPARIWGHCLLLRAEVALVVGVGEEVGPRAGSLFPCPSAGGRGWNHRGSLFPILPRAEREGWESRVWRVFSGCWNHQLYCRWNSYGKGSLGSVAPCDVTG